VVHPLSVPSADLQRSLLGIPTFRESSQPTRTEKQPRSLQHHLSTLVGEVLSFDFACSLSGLEGPPSAQGEKNIVDFFLGVSANDSPALIPPRLFLPPRSLVLILSFRRPF